MICIENQIRDNRKKSTAHTDFNLMTACSLCLAVISFYYGKSIWSLFLSPLTTYNHKEYISQLPIILMSMNTVNKINSMGNDFNGIFKTFHINFSKVYLKDTKKKFPWRNTHLVMYSDNNWKSANYISTTGTGFYLPVNMHETQWCDYHGNVHVHFPIALR